MRAKPDLVPDCDLHREPMYRQECRPGELGLEGTREVIVWRCAHAGCGRFFLGTVGYQSYPPIPVTADPSRRCARHGAFLVAQGGSFICPVAGCETERALRPSRSLSGDEIFAASHVVARH